MIDRPDPRRLRADAVGRPLDRQSRSARKVLAALGIAGLLVALACLGVGVGVPLAAALGTTTISAGLGATLALLTIAALGAAAGIWLFATYTVRNLRDLRATDEAVARQEGAPPLRPAATRTGTMLTVVTIAALLLAFGLPALALLDR